MSNEAITYVMGLTIGNSSRKFVMIALANYANADGEAYPSCAALEQITEMNRKTILAATRSLCDSGFISDTGQRKGRTGQVIVYKINGLNSTENGTVPKTEQYRKRIVTVPKTGHGYPKEPSGIDIKNKQKEKPEDMALPEFMTREAWKEFIEHRKQIKKPMTQLAAEKMLKNFVKYHEQGHDVQAMIDKAIECGWQSVYPPDSPPARSPLGRAYDAQGLNEDHPDDVILRGGEPKAPNVPMTEERRKRIEQEKSMG